MRADPCQCGFFRIGVIAYNLFIGFKRLFCKEEWRQTIATFRWKMIQAVGSGSSCGGTYCASCWAGDIAVGCGR